MIKEMFGVAVLLLYVKNLRNIFGKPFWFFFFLELETCVSLGVLGVLWCVFVFEGKFVNRELGYLPHCF